VAGVRMVQVLGHGVRIHACIWVLLQMALEVNFEVAFGRESVAADVALVRTFA